jgi:3'-phosphoadenosine 5'-phosphosulfate sulfotransferase (PAPS reductase)/FAD synthetase
MATKKADNKPKPNTAELLPLDEYDVIAVSFSGGKDSLACVLDLLDRGVDRDRIQLWHQRIDGSATDSSFMDWPITEAYCEAVADALGIRLLYQWKDGGFKGEMLREDATTKGIHFETQAGEMKYCAPSANGKRTTRRRFPQVSRDLSVRWCSAYLKIDVAARAITNDPALKSAKILFVTGERREESPNRATYAEIETHRTNTKKRTVHQWRSVIDWTESDVWSIIERYKINAHPCYQLGFGRCSCMSCIFGKADQWASVRALDPKRFAEILDYEREFDCTIENGASVEDQANAGKPFDEISTKTEERRIALERVYPADRVIVDSWEMPAGAGRATCCGGPS